MILKLLKPRKALNKAFLKLKPVRSDIERFKANLINLLDKINDAESEEYHKNLLSDFLKNTYYEPAHFINTKGRNDLVIHNGKSPASTVAVILETKKPTNKSEMISATKLNVKAFHELVLYYMRERIQLKNLEIRHLVASNIYEWYVFDAIDFDRLFAQNKSFVQQFTDFENGRLADTTTDFFYNQIAAPFIDSIGSEILCTRFYLSDYQELLHATDREGDKKLIALYKLLSPEHLLKLPFVNDSNTLDKRFYDELLHIIGLTETKDGGKKVIGRNAEAKRNPGSLLENAIAQLDSLDKISRLEKPARYGDNLQERFFNVALELCISWMNRILFLKLLEAQLLSYHNGDTSYGFLNSDKIQNYDDLNSLFFQVLARKYEDRDTEVLKQFGKVPYLNSSLFEPSELEHDTLFISNLRDERQLPIYGSTVLKDSLGRKKTGSLAALEYLFEFLDAYDFSSEGSEDIQEENKTLINASVLGLIFEKINGYKDGSFFTPGFITMYMCRETIRRAVVQKFNETKGWNCSGLDEIYDKIEDRDEANRIVNSIKIVDPAVGSGHFLVSALNEIIATKSDLKILQDRNGRRLKEYHVEVVNDELIVTDEDAELFEYNPASPESRRVQEALFHEKQSIIENCLFGVDINNNSVKICRLRLWIELLKNAYYKPETLLNGSLPQLETLPNIDINIKQGNSLVSRFALDADLRQALKKSKWSIESYRLAVSSYRNARNREEKRDMARLIQAIKTDFRSEITENDPKAKRLYKLRGELVNLTTQPELFDLNKKELERWNKQVEDLSSDIQKLEDEIEEIKSNKIYENAFEWRFEFPEVLNDEGEFVGFDVVIGNPPYIRQEEIKEFKPFFKSHYKLYTGTSDIYIFFIEKGFEILKHQGLFTYIMPNKFMQTGYGKPARKYLLEQNLKEIIDFGDFQVFEEATTYPLILMAEKNSPESDFKTVKINSPDFSIDFPLYVEENSNIIEHKSLNDETWIISNAAEQSILNKIAFKSEKLEDYIHNIAKYGIKTGLTEAFVIDSVHAEEILATHNNYENHLYPFLLGREAKPYVVEEPSKYLIKFEKGFTNSVFSGNPENWFMSEFEEIYKHLIQFKDRAIKRTDKGDYYWELRACDYYDLFDKPKIMYQRFQVKPCFIFDESGLYCNDSMWIIPSDDMVLLGILNSKMGWWLISKYCTAIQNGYQLIWKYFSQIPIAIGNEPIRNEIKSRVNSIIDLKKEDSTADIITLEAEIDQLVYELYGLNEEEIAIVENAI